MSDYLVVSGSEIGMEITMAGFLPSYFLTGVIPLSNQSSMLPVSNYQELHNILSPNFITSNSSEFSLPSLSGLLQVGSNASVTGKSSPTIQIGQITGTDLLFISQNNLPTTFGGLNTPLHNQQASVGVEYLINTNGIFPNSQGLTPHTVGVVTPFFGSTAPAGYLPCDGRELNINDYQ